MKQPIRYIIFSFLISIFQLQNSGAKGQNLNSISLSGINFYDEKNNRFNLNDSQTAVIVIRNYQGCNDCFLEIDRWIKENTELPFYSLAFCDSSTLSRKREISYSKRLIKNGNALVLYQENIDSFFSSVREKISPLILLLNRGKFKIIPYKEIFVPSSATIQPDLNRKIAQFFR